MNLHVLLFVEFWHRFLVGFYVWVVIRKKLYGPAPVGDRGQRVDCASKIPSASND